MSKDQCLYNPSEGSFSIETDGKDVFVFQDCYRYFEEYNDFYYLDRDKKLGRLIKKIEEDLSELKTLGKPGKRFSKLFRKETKKRERLLRF